MSFKQSTITLLTGTREKHCGRPERERVEIDHDLISKNKKENNFTQMSRSVKMNTVTEWYHYVSSLLECIFNDAWNKLKK